MKRAKDSRKNEAMGISAIMLLLDTRQAELKRRREQKKARLKGMSNVDK